MKKFWQIFLKKGLVSLLTFTLVVSSIPAIVFGDETTQTQQTSVTQKPITTRQEVKALRTETSKTYKNPDGTYTAEVMSESIHYKVGNQWEEIDNSLVPSTNNQDYENKSNKFKVRFNKNISKQSKRLLTYQINNHSVDFEVYQNLSQMNNVVGNNNKNEMKYKNTYSGVSYDYKVDGSKVKENIVLDSYPNTNSFKFIIKGANLTAKKLEDGKIYFYDKDTNQFQFFIQKPFMYDLEANKGDEPNLSENVTQDIAETDGGYILTITADDKQPGQSAKDKRQQAIFELIQSGKYWTQTEIVRELINNGFTTVQGTVSRDIQQMKIGKAEDGSFCITNETLQDIHRNELLKLLEKNPPVYYKNIVHHYMKVEGGKASSIAFHLQKAFPDVVLDVTVAMDSLYVTINMDADTDDFLHTVSTS